MKGTVPVIVSIPELVPGHTSAGPATEPAGGEVMYMLRVVFHVHVPSTMVYVMFCQPLKPPGSKMPAGVVLGPLHVPFSTVPVK